MQERQALLELLKIGISENCVFSDILCKADWNEVLKMAHQHGVTCLCMKGLEVMHQQGVDLCPSSVKLQMYGRSELTKRNFKHNFDLSAEFAEKAKPLRIVVLKGCDYARYWPKREWREQCDLDCVALEGQTLNAAALDSRAKWIGCECEDGGYKHSHLRYKGLSIENHHYFTAFGGSATGRSMEKELRNLFVGTYGKIDGTSLYYPNPEFTAVFMLAHAQMHFFFEGLSLRHILDWHFFLMREDRNVDWPGLEYILEKTRLKRFAEQLTRFCRMYLGLQFDGLAKGTAGKTGLDDKFLDDLFAEKYSDSDRRWKMFFVRMANRYARIVRFRSLNKMSVVAAVWRTIAYSSFLHRQPEL